MALNLIECPQCATVIVPTGDGACPSCRHNVKFGLPPEQVAKLDAVREPIAELDAIEEAGTVYRSMVLLAIGAAFVAVDFLWKLNGAPNSGFIPNWLNGVFALVLGAYAIHFAMRGRMLEHIARRTERKRCPNCGREVSRHAPACPRCDLRFVQSMPMPRD